MFAEEVKSDGKVSVSVAPFETKVNGYTFVLSKGSLSVLVVDDKDFKIGRFDLEMSNSVNLRSGDVVTLKYDSYAKRSMIDKGVVLQGDSVTYTVKTPAVTTVPTTVAPTLSPRRLPNPPPKHRRKRRKRHSRLNPKPIHTQKLPHAEGALML